VKAAGAPPVTVIGAGAIGGTIGAHVVRAGTPVRFVDADPDHVAAMRARGLTIKGFAETFTVPVEAANPSELMDPLGTVLLAVKAQHTADALKSVAPLLGPDSCVVSLQNGLCERLIADVVGADRTVGCLVNLSADYLEPGVIAYGGVGAVRLGELDGRLSDRVLELQRLLSAWGPVEVTDNVWGYLWAKLGYANMMFATAMTDEPAGETISAYRPLMVELASEVYEVAAREGVRPEPFDGIEPDLYHPPQTRDWTAIDASFDRWLEKSKSNQKTRTGIWRDLAVRRRRTEVDEQIGRVAEIGRGHGLPMTLTSRLTEMIHELEDGTRQRGRGNVDELESLRRTTGDTSP
jgi:2-dehydropantoate 2-reductase